MAFLHSRQICSMNLTLAGQRRFVVRRFITAFGPAQSGDKSPYYKLLPFPFAELLLILVLPLFRDGKNKPRTQYP